MHGIQSMDGNGYLPAVAVCKGYHYEKRYTNRQRRPALMKKIPLRMQGDFLRGGGEGNIAMRLRRGQAPALRGLWMELGVDPYDASIVSINCFTFASTKSKCMAWI